METHTDFTRFTHLLGRSVTRAQLLSGSQFDRDSQLSSHLLTLSDAEQVVIYELSNTPKYLLEDIAEPELTAGTDISWVYPNDPVLKTLPAIVDLAGTATILDRLNIHGAVQGLDLVSYRPLKSAVVKVSTTTETFFLKALSSARVQLYFEQNKALTNSGIPVPELIAWTEDGLVVAHALQGTSLFRFDPQQIDYMALFDTIDAFLDQLPQAPFPQGVSLQKSPISTRAEHYAKKFIGTPWSETAAVLAETLTRIQKGESDLPKQTVHGDLHFDQLFFDPELTIIGALDFDRLTVGSRVDDFASLIGFETFRLFFDEAWPPIITGLIPVVFAKNQTQLPQLISRISTVLYAHAASILGTDKDQLVTEILARAQLLIEQLENPALDENSLISILTPSHIAIADLSYQGNLQGEQDE